MNIGQIIDAIHQLRGDVVALRTWLDQGFESCTRGFTQAWTRLDAVEKDRKADLERVAKLETRLARAETRQAERCVSDGWTKSEAPVVGAAIFGVGTRVRSTPAFEYCRAYGTEKHAKALIDAAYGSVIPRPFYATRQDGRVWVLCDDKAVRSTHFSNLTVVG